MSGFPTLEPAEALVHWRRADEPLRPAPDAGLINRTWLVGPDPAPTAVLQWVNPIFHPRIHDDIEAVTARLAQQGLTTTRLIRTNHGELWIPDSDAPDDPDDAAIGCWRLLTFVPGVTVHRLRTPELAAVAGDLVGRFHAAVAGWDYRFRAPRRNVHDTVARMADLEAALADADRHPLATEARQLGASILEAWQVWQRDGRLDLPERSCHGDLKISNLRFTEAEGKLSGVCLLDLDTLGPQTLAAEMGDAWRSWCNPSGEDDPEAVRFDLDLFAASARAWSAHVTELTAAEVESLVPGIERICLELASRFCADAVTGTYFQEDRERFAQPGRHNLMRAASQRELARQARSVRERCAELLVQARTRGAELG